jgi:hypothetical protein
MQLVEFGVCPLKLHNILGLSPICGEALSMLK